MAMSFATMQTLIDAATTTEAKIRIIVDYLRDNSISDVVSAAAIVNAIPSSDQSDAVTIWNDTGVLKVSS